MKMGKVKMGHIEKSKMGKWEKLSQRERMKKGDKKRGQIKYYAVGVGVKCLLILVK